MSHVHRGLWLLLLICASFPNAALASTQSELDARAYKVEIEIFPEAMLSGEESVPSTLRQRMKLHKVPGVSIAVFEGQRVVWAKGFGVADVATKQPVSIETLFQAASISKPVSAIAALRLVEKGILNTGFQRSLETKELEAA